MIQSPFPEDPEGSGDDLHDPPGRQIQPSLAPSPVVPVRPPEQRLLLGHCERLLHLDFATIMDGDVFKGLVAGVGLCRLNLIYHILEDKEDPGG